MQLRATSQPAARIGTLSILLLALTCFAPATGHAALSPYAQSFEAMVQTDPGALSGDGWLVFGNVFSPSNVYLYGYGPFPAPNGGPPFAFSTLASGQGGVTQGNLQLSVFSDYESAEHANGNLVESNVFQERTVGSADVGNTWYFEFDAKRGDLAGNSQAVAFIKTLSPPTFALTNFLVRDMRAISPDWRRYGIPIAITADLVGQIFQFGFACTATNYEPSGVYYDNVELTMTSTVGVPAATVAGPGIQLSTQNNPAMGSASQVLTFSMPRGDRVAVRVYDVRGGLVTTLLDREVAAGAHSVTWRGNDAAGRAVPAGLYVVEVASGADRAIAKLNRLR